MGAWELDGLPFFVLLGPDYAGKSTTMSELAKLPSPWRFVSVDDGFLGPGHKLVAQLKRQLIDDALPGLGRAYSADFVASLLQTAVVHMRDQIIAGDRRRPALVDSYYFKILAKCRLVGGGDANPLFAWWRSFPQPRRVVYLDVAPETAWARGRSSGRINRLEHYREHAGRAEFTAFQADLGKLLLDEVEHLPVSVIPERANVAEQTQAVREVLENELD